MVVRFLIVQLDKINKFTNIALCLILAGGISNLLDRIIRGFVVDYINIEDVIPFPIFNVADIYIVIGWTLLIIFTIINVTKFKE